MENLHQDTEVKIPTKNVYIFIEKVPVDYAIVYSGSGQSVSEKGAVRSLPGGTGLESYGGENRWILMSRIYYWAQAFKEKYPNEMQVYYETDQFVCYKIEQNMYHLYNFAIDIPVNCSKICVVINMSVYPHTIVLFLLHKSSYQL